MTTITRERLLKIQQWRETYGPGSNVVLPAEEAEELARIALASLEAEPVAWIVHARTGDQLTTYSDYVANAEGILGLHSTPLYTAPPAPVVADEIAAALIVAIEKEQERLFGEDYLMDSKDCVDVIREEARRFNACRAAMFQGKE